MAGFCSDQEPKLLFVYTGVAEEIQGRIKRWPRSPLNSVLEAPVKTAKPAAVNNWRLQGQDYFRIMAASGHKTMHVFKRYNTVSKEELKALNGAPA